MEGKNTLIGYGITLDRVRRGREKKKEEVSEDVKELFSPLDDTDTQASIINALRKRNCEEEEGEIEREEGKDCD